MLKRSLAVCLLLVIASAAWSTALAQNPPRTPTETTRAFYSMLREKKYREAFALSIYQPAVEGLSAPEFEDLRPDFDKMAQALIEKLPAAIDVSGEQISGDMATVFVKVLDAEGKERIEPAALIKTPTGWVVGDKESLDLVKKAGKKFFFEARVNAHHNDVQDMMTRISLAQVLYSQSHNSSFGNMAELIAAGVIPKDIEGTESTGYRFQINRSADAKSWYATAEPVEYGRTGRLSFYLDASGVRSGDAGGKPLSIKNN
ncbi:MAG TPA: hypothetical protein VHQ94_13640 [Pyrinomonadaceae bacterium]|jgi:hypothetical protein|nr:hypothetical protein [Pyrinomonadaceae bacterium]